MGVYFRAVSVSTPLLILADKISSAAFFLFLFCLCVVCVWLGVFGGVGFFLSFFFYLSSKIAVTVTLALCKNKRKRTHTHTKSALLLAQCSVQFVKIPRQLINTASIDKMSMCVWGGLLGGGGWQYGMEDG